MRRLASRVAFAALFASACYSGGPPDPAPPQVGAPQSLAPIRRLRRLSAREYDNVVRDLLGDATHPARRFVVDAFPNGYDNGSAGLAVQSDQVVDYQGAAEALAATAVASAMPLLVGACDPALGAPCVEAFLTGFAARAYRRPLTPTEAQRLRDVFAADAGAGFARGLRTMLEVVLQSPQFLYREELGAPDAKGATARLTDWEIASELSFLLTGSIPDDELWRAVAEGRFTTDDDRQREATRLLGTPGAREALRAFLHEWLGTDRVATTTKARGLYPTFDEATALSMSAELDAFYDMAASGGSLRLLFTSNRSFADARLDALYGASPAAPASVALGSSMQPIALDPSVRPGVLTRAGFLAVHADTDSSGPIARGVFILDRVMCAPPPQPPANVPPAPPVGDPRVKDQTTRQRFANHASTPFCASCHDRIDGIGFGFEEFDAIGRLRATENGQPIDASGVVVGTGEIDGPYVGAAALVDRLAGSKVLAECYARQAYRWAMGEIEPAGLDPRALGALTTDARLADVLLAIVASPLFVTRSFERTR